MSTPDEETKHWLRYALEDLASAEAMRTLTGVAPRNACYFAQQAAEKALKAALIFLQINFPYRHDLDELRDLLPDDWQTKTACDDLSALTDWVTEARYPTRLPDATANDADAAITQARLVCGSIEADLVAHGFTP